MGSLTPWERGDLGEARSKHIIANCCCHLTNKNEDRFRLFPNFFDARFLTTSADAKQKRPSIKICLLVKLLKNYERFLMKFIGSTWHDRRRKLLDFGFFVDCGSLAKILCRQEIAAVLIHLFSQGGSTILGGVLRSMIAASMLIVFFYGCWHCCLSLCKQSEELGPASGNTGPHPPKCTETRITFLLQILQYDWFATAHHFGLTSCLLRVENISIVRDLL